MAPLTDFVLSLRARDANEYPYFDPADGGVAASLLFLFEKPGPMTVQRGRHARMGSGFISRDNDDPTAEATFNFMREAGIPRAATILWNTVPGWNGTRRITATELRAGLDDLRSLLELLPDVRTMVLVGRNAGRAERSISALGRHTIFKCAHPSPLVRASHIAQWQAIPSVWRNAAQEADVWACRVTS